VAAVLALALVPGAGASAPGSTGVAPTPSPGVIGGTVTTPDSDGTATGLASISVAAYAPGASTPAASAVTDASGAYQITGLAPGRYQVRFSDPTSAFATAWYPDAVDRGGALARLVRSGVTTSADDRLFAPGSVSGTVTAADSTQLNGIAVTLADAATGTTRAMTTTAADGSFSFPVLTQGLYGASTYVLRFRDPAGVYASQTSGPVTTNVPAGQPAASVTEVLPLAGALAGTATKAGLGVAGVPVAVVPVGSTTPAASTSTGSGGKYAVGGLPVGSYDVRFGSDTGAWATVWFDDVSDQSAATPIAVGAGTTANVAPEPVATALHLSLLVNTAADTRDAHPGDHICADATNKCSLRAAIDEANANPSSDAITIARGVNPRLTRVGAAEDANATGDVDVLDTLTIHGQGATVDAGGLDRAIESLAGTLTIDHLTVTGGSTARDTLPGGGDDGGGILALGNLTLVSSTVVGNDAERFAVGGGGGIAVMGSLTMIDSTVSRNTAHSNGGGVYVIGGPTVIVDSTVDDNQALVHDPDVNGDESSAAVTIGSRFVPSASVLIVGSSISDNLSLLNDEGRSGGGLVFNATSVEVADSTVVGNDSEVYPDEDFHGCCGAGGVSGLGGPVALVDDTIANTGWPGMYQILPAGGDGPFYVSGSTVAGGVPVCNGAFASLGSDIFTDTSCQSLFLDLSDRQPADPLLGPLGPHGGPTPTEVPMTGSPAIDAVPPGTPVLCDGTLPTDQRGVPRPQGAACDIGAVEVVAPASA
jgi:CSLREA domain-containing protein